MRRSLIYTLAGIFGALFLLFVFNKITSRKNSTDIYTQAVHGEFEISLSVAGELMAESSIEIKGPDFSTRRDVRSTNIKIQDLVPEGTIVKVGDYIAELDRTELNNNLKDYEEFLTERLAKLGMKKLDTAVVLNDYRNAIKNQRFQVEEAQMTLDNSKYEPPTVIRQAEIQLDKAKRTLEQRQRSYTRVVAQTRTDIYNQEYYIGIIERRVNDLKEVLAGFTITAPASGMVIYKKEWRGNKRKVGSSINPFDRVVATLPDLSAMLSKTYVSEIDISKIKEGQAVVLTVDAFPKKSYSGYISYVAKIGEILPNSNDKVFEVQVKVKESDQQLRPSMTTGNKIIIKKIADAVYVPIECVHADADSVSYVYTKKRQKQIVLLGDSNEKSIVIEKGLDAGTMIYVNSPAEPEKFRITGEELISLSKDRQRQLPLAEN